MPQSTLGLMLPPTIGIDPGPVWTGLAARSGTQLLDAKTLRIGGALPNGVAHRAAQFDWQELHRLCERIGQTVDAWERQWPELSFAIACEAPTPTAEYIDKRRQPGHARIGWHTAATMAVVGWVLASWPSVTLVEPDRLSDVHNALGRGMETCYPVELCRTRAARLSPTEHPKASMGHERAAWQVAGLAGLAIV